MGEHPWWVNTTKKAICVSVVGDETLSRYCPSCVCHAAEGNNPMSGEIELEKASNPQPTAHEGSKSVEGGQNLDHPEGRGEWIRVCTATV